MDDLELDRALREALSATPSPEFVARARTAIAESPRPSIVAGWLKPAAAACAVVLAIVVGVLQREGTAPVTGPKPSPTYVPPGPANLPPGPGNLPPGATTAPASPVVTRSVVVPTFRSAIPPADSAAPPTRPTVAITSEPPLPEVIVAADDVAALVQFVSGARDLRFVASFDETPASVPWVVTDLSIGPIAGDALDPTPVHNN